MWESFSIGCAYLSPTGRERIEWSRYNIPNYDLVSFSKYCPYFDTVIEHLSIEMW